VYHHVSESKRPKELTPLRDQSYLPKLGSYPCQRSQSTLSPREDHGIGIIWHVIYVFFFFFVSEALVDPIERILMP
jgi:hypothetical protein